MSSRVRNLIILLSLLAVTVVGLVLAFVLLDEPVEEDSPIVNRPQISQNNDPVVITDKTYVIGEDGKSSENKVTKFIVANQYGEFAVVPRDDGTLCAESYFGLPRDSAMIDAMCEPLLCMEAVTTVDAEEEDSAYGFDSPTLTLTAVYSDKTIETFVFGSVAVGTEGYYCRRESDTEGNLYIVEKALVEQYLVEEKDLIGKTLIAPPSPDADDKEGKAQLLTMELSGSFRKEPIRMITDVDGIYGELTTVSTYVIEKPFLRSIDSDEFYLEASAMLSLKAAGVACPYPTEEDLARYGLDKDPYSIANLTFAVVRGESTDDDTVKMNYYNERKHVIVLGDKDEKGNYYALVNYEMEDGTTGVYNAVYLLSPDSVPWAEMTFFDLTDKKLFLKHIRNVDNLTVTLDGTSYAFDLTHHENATNNDDKITVTHNGEKFGTYDFRILYELMIKIHRSAEKDADFEKSGEPKYVVALSFNDGTEAYTFSFYEMSSSRYLLVTQDGEEVAVSISDTDEFIKQVKRYIVGEDVRTPY